MKCGRLTTLIGTKYNHNMWFLGDFWQLQSRLQVKSESESHSVVSNSVTPWTIQSMEFFRPEYWSGWPFPSPGDLPNPGIEPGSPALQADSLPTKLSGKPGLLVQNWIPVLECCDSQDGIERDALILLLYHYYVLLLTSDYNITTNANSFNPHKNSII